MATTTFFPDPDPESTSVDGRAYHYDAAGITWAAIRGGAGIGAQSSNAAFKIAGVYADTVTDRYDEIDRYIGLFDTSAITDSDTIDSATLSLKPTTTTPITDELGGSHGYALVASNPASDTNLVSGDFTTLGSTRFASDVALSSMSADTYFDFTLNASGLAAITTTGVSKFGVRVDIDLDNSEPTWASDEEITVRCYIANQTGTGSDPKLVVVHTSTVNSASLDLESGSSQYASIADGSQTGLDITGDMTIEAWVKFESEPGDFVMVSKWGDGTGDRSYRFGYHDSAGTKSLRLYISTNGTANETLTVVTTAIATGVWSHVACTFDASTSTAEMFINGLSIGSDTGSYTSLYNGVESFAIGCAVPDGTQFGFVDGLIEDVRVWNDIRTDQEIVDNLYLELDGTEANLQGYWKLNNDYLDETSNGNDLTASGSPVFSTSVPWTETNANSLDLESTSNQYAADTTTSGLNITGDMTMEFWVKPESLSTDMWIIDSGTSGSETEADNINFQARIESTGEITYFHEYSTGTNDTVTTVSSYITAGTWFHIAIGRDVTGNNILFYVDGVLKETIGYTSDPTGGATGNKLYVGINNGLNTGIDYDGLIDEIRIWDVLRTVDQIVAAKDTAIKEDHTNLQACYAFDDDYLDETSNNNDLTATGSPTFNVDVPFPVAAAITATGTNMYIIL